MQVSNITTSIKAAGFTATGLCEALLQVTDVPVTGEAQARIHVILDGLCNLPLSEGSALIKEAVKQAPKAVEKTAKVRASECRQIYGAVKANPELRPELEAAGWHGATAKARAFLESRGMKWNMMPITSKEERDAKRDQKMLAEVLAKRLSGDPQAVKDEATLARISAEARAEATAAQEAEVIEMAANRVIKTHGTALAAKIADAIVGILTKLETDKTTAAQQVAAKVEAVATVVKAVKVVKAKRKAEKTQRKAT